MDPTAGIDRLIARMQALLEQLQDSPNTRDNAVFLSTYLRTTKAVASDLTAGRFLDSAWTEEWDIAFANLYLDALEQWTTGGTAPKPWRVAFASGQGQERLPPLRHLLLGMNAHINYDLPQALLAVITDEQFHTPALVARRRADQDHIDEILADRVKDEDRHLRALEQSGDRTWLDRSLTPLNRQATRRFLKEARSKVWHNALLLNQARRVGALHERLSELESLSAQRVADLRAPGQVVLRLARNGFGVQLDVR